MPTEIDPDLLTFGHHDADGLSAVCYAGVPVPGLRVGEVADGTHRRVAAMWLRDWLDGLSAHERLRFARQEGEGDGD